MASLQPIGSVLQIDDHRFVVVGHRVTRDGDVMGAGYLVVPYPLGFVTRASILLVPASAVSGVVHEGYASEQGGAYLAEFEGLVDASAGVPFVEYEASVRLLSDFAEKEGRNG